MPTGYTAKVSDGTLTEFPEFAMQCARAFGALISMRDEPASAPIPDKFEPSPYYKNALVEAQEELAKLKSMTVQQQQVRCDSEYGMALVRNEKFKADKALIRLRYEAMLKHVTAWQPPTPDHEELKNFMIKQLKESIDFDCIVYGYPDPVRLKRSEWHAKAVDDAEACVARREKDYADEVDRCAKRTAWVQELRASLTKP